MKKIYIFIILALVILDIVSFYYFYIRKDSWEKEKKSAEQKIAEYKLKSAESETKYNTLLQKIQEYETKLASLAQELSLFKKEKEGLLQEAERLAAPEYLADIITDRIRLKVEVKTLEEKIKARDGTIASLAKYKETLEALLGQEKHLSQRLTNSIAEERKKSYSLNLDVSQKSSLLAKTEAKITGLEKVQQNLKDKIIGLEKIVEDTDREMKALEKKLNEAHGEKKSLERQLSQIKEEKALLEEELTETKLLYEEARTNKETLENELANLTKEKESLASNLLSTSQKVVELDDKLEKAELALSERELENKGFKEKYEKLLEENKLALQNLEQKESSLKVELSRTITLPQEQAPLPEVKGNILVTSEKHNFVIINIGEEDGVKAGDRFSIYRADKKLADIEVTRSRSKSSFANIISLTGGITITTEDAVR